MLGEAVRKSRGGSTDGWKKGEEGMREIESGAEETKKPGRYSAYSRLSECLPLAASAYCSQIQQHCETAPHFYTLCTPCSHNKAERQKSSIKCGRYQLSSLPLPLFSLSFSSPFGLFPSGRAVQFTFPLSILISISLLLAFFSLFFIVAFLLLHSPSPPLIFIFPPVIVCVCALSLVSLNMLHVPRVISFEFELYNFIFNNNSLTLFITYLLYFQLLSSAVCRT